MLQEAHTTHNIPVQDFCLKYIVKDPQWSAIVMSKQFEKLDRNLLVEIIRQKQRTTSNGGANRIAPQGLMAAAEQPTGGNADHPPAAPPANAAEECESKGSRLPEDMLAVLEGTVCAELRDITLVVGNSHILAHSAVLASRSGFFEGLVRSFMPPDGNVQMTIGNLTPSIQACHSLLRYIYAGETQMPPQDSLYLFMAPFYFGFANSRLQVSSTLYWTCNFV